MSGGCGGKSNSRPSGVIPFIRGEGGEIFVRMDGNLLDVVEMQGMLRTLLENNKELRLQVIKLTESASTRPNGASEHVVRKLKLRIRELKRRLTIASAEAEKQDARFAQMISMREKSISEEGSLERAMARLEECR